MPKRHCRRPAHLYGIIILLLHCASKTKKRLGLCGHGARWPGCFSTGNRTIQHITMLLKQYPCRYCDGHRVLYFCFYIILYIVILPGRNVVLLKTSMYMFLYILLCFVPYIGFDFKNKNCIQSRSYTIFTHCKNCACDPVLFCFGSQCNVNDTLYAPVVVGIVDIMI